MESLGSTTAFCIISLLKNRNTYVIVLLRAWDGNCVCLRSRELENKTVGRVFCAEHSATSLQG